jgi:hypothetical protein
MMRFPFARTLGVLATTAALSLAACDDDPVSPGTDPDPAGLSVTAGSQALVEVDGSTVTGELEIDEGSDTGTFAVVFLDDEGDTIDLDEDYYLDVVIDDDEVATFSADEDEAFEGVIEGVAAGATTVVFRLMKGEPGSGEEIYASPEIDVTVS